MGVYHTQPIPMGVDNLWHSLPGKYRNVFIKWKTGCHSREPAKGLGWFFQLVLVKNIGVTHDHLSHFTIHDGETTKQ